MSRFSTLFATLVLATACSSSSDDGGPTTPVADATVTMSAASFSPRTVLLLQGGTVTWENTSGVSHNVTFSGVAPANIGNHTNGSNDRDFPDTGEFNYTCTNHAGMTGRITVVAQ